MKMALLKKLTIVVAAWILIQAMPVSAAVYSYIDERGIIHLTDRPTDSRFRLLYASKKETREWKVLGRSVPKDSYKHEVSPFDSAISDAASRYGLNSALIKAVIKAESGFDPMAVSKKGAVGLMQLMPATAKRYGVANSLDPVANIDGGARMLRELLTLFDNDVRLSLAAYNAGSNAVKKYGNAIPPYPETERYVGKVLKFYRKYRQSM